jgi:hypothetical protein
MKCLHRAAAAGAVLAVGLCGWVRGQVLEQVPSDAVGVFEVKDLQGLSTKVAKFAKTLGIDQFDPRWADPLASLQDEFDLKQGVNKTGDMAIAVFDRPDKKQAKDNSPAGEGGAPPVVVLISTDDYKAFLGNFADVKDEGDGISQATVKKDQEKLYIMQRGKYAVSAMDKLLLTGHKDLGLKLEGAAAKDVESKDAIFFVDIKTLRPRIQDGMKQAHEMMNQQFNNANANGNAGNPFAAQMTPQMRKIMDIYFKVGQQIVKDVRWAEFSFNLTDIGINTGSVASFETDSDLGKMMAQVQNTDQPLLAGLPEATYFAYGAAKVSPEVASKLFGDYVQPMMKDMLSGNADADKEIDAAKDAVLATKTLAGGYVSTGGAPGQGLLGVVAVAHGDANKILADRKISMAALSQMMGFMGTKNSINIAFGEPTTVSDVKLENYTMKFNFDGKDQQAAAAKQVISMIYGRDGLHGSMGVVNPDTLVELVGTDDQLASAAIAAAKDNTDALDQMKGVQKVAAELPKSRAFEGFIALDNVANAAVKLAKQQGLAVQFKLPPNLPPIGISGGTQESSVRFNMLIPTQLIQSITAAGMQAFMQQNGGAGNGGGI